MQLDVFGLFSVGLNGAVNGSAACPPTTQSGSFTISPPPVQLASKASQNSEPSNSHHTSTQHHLAELAGEKPVQKNKEKVSRGKYRFFRYNVRRALRTAITL